TSSRTTLPLHSFNSSVRRWRPAPSRPCRAAQSRTSPSRCHQVSVSWLVPRLCLYWPSGSDRIHHEQRPSLLMLDCDQGPQAQVLGPLGFPKSLPKVVGTVVSRLRLGFNPHSLLQESVNFNEKMPGKESGTPPGLPGAEASGDLLPEVSQE